MKQLYRLEDFTPSSEPISLTIGNFDGIHLGHQAILSRLTNRKVVFTFSNHPAEVLYAKPSSRLITFSHRLHLLSSYGIDTTLVTPFTEAFSKQSAEEFLLKLRAFIPFSHLVLGHDAVLGHARQGDSTQLLKLAKREGFLLEYLEAVKLDGIIVSSSEIRKQIQLGSFERANQLLGRPYSILAPIEPGAQNGRLLGFQTANLNVNGLCLPPLGVYAVSALLKGKHYQGVANLGRAPTLHADRPPILEVHLLDYDGELYGEELEVVFLKFLREERRFDSIEDLKAQIHKDIGSARAYRTN